MERQWFSTSRWERSVRIAMRSSAVNPEPASASAPSVEARCVRRNGLLQRCLPRAATVVLLGLWAFLALDCAVIAPPNGWSKRWGPLVAHRTFPGDCGICHVPNRWDMLKEGFSFDHEKETGFALEGAHSRAVCLR